MASALERPSFSIVVPTYRRREIVSEALRAIAAIEYDRPREVVVIVDGSTDGTEAALADIECPFPKRVIVQDNEGAAAARNRGAAVSSGDILLFLDDDMMCRADILDQHARSLAAGADAVLGHIPLDPLSPKTFLACATGLWADRRAGELRDGAALTPFEVMSGHISIRRSVFEELGGFDTSFTAGGSYGGEDLEFGARLMERHKVVFNPDAVASQRYVVSPGEYLRQWGDAGRADAHLARKHPRHAEELFALRGAREWTTRLLLRPIAASRPVSRAICASSLWLAERERHWPKPLQRLLAHAFLQARGIAYWAGVREAGG